MIVLQRLELFLWMLPKTFMQEDHKLWNQILFVLRQTGYEDIPILLGS